jgi:4-diphosphocytidyl-2-C-methyl-D-erythritol kinase
MSRASAPGKLNIYFAVGPLRADGYHSVASVYQALNLLEVVSVTPSAKWEVETLGDLTAAQKALIPDPEQNLVVKAAQALAQSVGLTNPQPMAFQIQKQGPVAGGMGGGSADAAAALVALNDAWCLGLEKAVLMEIAAGLGADVPFSLFGNTALGTGTGTDLSEMHSANLNWVMVLSETTLSTPVVFQKLDELRSARGEDPTANPEPTIPQQLVDALTSGPTEVAKQMHNDLHLPALELLPALRELEKLGDRLGALRTMVSGSGPTMAMLAKDSDSAVKLSSDLRQRGHRAIACHGPMPGATLLEN